VWHKDECYDFIEEILENWTLLFRYGRSFCGLVEESYGGIFSDCGGPASDVQYEQSAFLRYILCVFCGAVTIYSMPPCDLVSAQITCLLIPPLAPLLVNFKTETLGMCNIFTPLLHFTFAARLLLPSQIGNFPFAFDIPFVFNFLIISCFFHPHPHTTLYEPFPS